jgi:hypothetical protein
MEPEGLGDMFVLVAGVGFALTDALHLRGVQGIDLLAAAVVASSAQEAGDTVEQHDESGAHPRQRWRS